MSPEQTAGDPVDGATDQYAVAGVLYGLLAGRTLPSNTASTPSSPIQASGSPVRARAAPIARGATTASCRTRARAVTSSSVMPAAR